MEGFVHKLKLFKRQDYGGAGFELLRERVLAAWRPLGQRSRRGAPLHQEADRTQTYHPRS